jgi:hypothetical protein
MYDLMSFREDSMNNAAFNLVGDDNIGLVDDDEAAKRLLQKPGTLASWRATGRGPPFYKVGRRVFYHPHDLRGWLTEQRQVPQPR